MPDPHEVLWYRDEHGNPQQATRSNAEQNHPDWKPMTKSDHAKTCPEVGDETDPEE
jgi:hypothetical protein